MTDNSPLLSAVISLQCLHTPVVLDCNDVSPPVDAFMCRSSQGLLSTTPLWGPGICREGFLIEADPECNRLSVIVLILEFKR